MVKTAVRTIRDDWFIREKEDKDFSGWVDIYYGVKGDDSQRGHRVERNGSCEYHRTIDGQVLVDGRKRN